jgi:hypothetical protein
VAVDEDRLGPGVVRDEEREVAVLLAPAVHARALRLVLAPVGVHHATPRVGDAARVQAGGPQARLVVQQAGTVQADVAQPGPGLQARAVGVLELGRRLVEREQLQAGAAR